MESLFFFGTLCLSLLTGIHLLKKYHPKLVQTNHYYQNVAPGAFQFIGYGGVMFLLYTVSKLLHFTSNPILLFLTTALLSFGVGVLSLALGFDLLYKTRQATWLRYIFYIGLILTVFFAGSVSIWDGSYADYAGPISIAKALNFIIDCLTMILITELSGLFCTWLLTLFVGIFDHSSHRQSKKVRQAQRANRNMMQHYYDAGMDDEEITFFRSQMSTLSHTIENIEREFNKAAKLRAIETRHNTISVCQNFFKDIVNEPKQLVRASHFVYKTAPSLDDILSKYNEVAGHVAKNNQTYLILEKSAQTIDNLCIKISEEYIDFHQEDYAALDDEINLANKHLNTHTTDITQTSTDDDITQPEKLEDSVKAIIDEFQVK